MDVKTKDNTEMFVWCEYLAFSGLIGIISVLNEAFSNWSLFHECSSHFIQTCL